MKNKKINTILLSSILGANVINVLSVDAYDNIIKNYKNTKNIQGSIAWEENLADKPGATSFFSTNVIGDKIYCIGGYGYNKIDIYDVSKNEWSTINPPENIQVEEAVTVTVEDKIYIINQKNYTSKKVIVYDTTLKTWTEKGDFPASAYPKKGVYHNGKIYSIGAENMAVGGYTDDMYIYDVATDTWGDVVETPFASTGSTEVMKLVGDKIYCLLYNSGRFFDEPNTKFFFYIYDINSGEWKRKANPNMQNHENCSGDIINDNLYILGAKVYNSSSRVEPTVEMYDESSDSWKVVGEMKTPRRNMEVASYNNKIYCIGGVKAGFQDTAMVDAFYIKEPTKEEVAESAVVKVENEPTVENLKNARGLVNDLDESETKDDLQDRLNVVEVEMELVKKNATANVDVYIKSENMLKLTLSTNSISFDDFSGVTDMVKPNALELTVSSSLPYQVDAYLATEIQNADKSKTMDKEILKIKANEKGEDAYASFVDVNNTPITLLDDQDADNDVVHGVDFKLKGGDAFEKDIYKATIKFEVKQK